MTVTPYTGLAFWSLLAIPVVAHAAIPAFRRIAWMRNLLMLLISYTIILFAQEPVVAGMLSLGLLLLTLLVYGIGKYMLESQEGGRKRLSAVLGIVAVLLILCYFKYEYVQDMLRNFLSVVLRPVKDSGSIRHLYFLGISYFSFKLIHFLVDCFNGKIRKLDLLTFANYVSFFPGFFAGPINRYSVFADDMLNAKDADYRTGGMRIINGLFKKTVAGIIQPFTITAIDLSQSHPSSKLILGVYAYMFFIYFDFSGYSDLAIGSSRLMGVTLPENFNNPFLKRNLQQFWANWHMSLTTWLTDYIYWPLARKFRHVKALATSPVATSNICIILTFVVCGLWHGEGFNFFLWGAYHGLGLAGLNCYNQLVNRRTSMGVRKFLNTSRTAQAVGVFVTFQYVAVGFLLFACDMTRINLFLGGIFG